MAAFLQINVTTTSERYAATNAVKNAVMQAGGWITGYTRFSNVSLCLNFEIESHMVARLSQALAIGGIVLSNASLSALREAAAAGRCEGEIRGTIQITFVHSEPDLRLPAPPG
jgi:hypothetical protein